MRHLLSIGADTEDVLLEELADEAKRYLNLVEELRDLEDGPRRDDVEGELYASISHLAGHGHLLLEHLDQLVDELPDDPEETPA